MAWGAVDGGRRRGWLRMDVCESERIDGLLYIGAAEMAQGRGRWRKWRGAVVGDGSGARPSLFSFLLRRTWAASCFITFIPFPISSSPS